MMIGRQIKEQIAVDLLPTLPVRKIWGVGHKTEKSLNALGIFTIGDLLGFDRDFFLKAWGRRGYELLQLAQGIDHSLVTSHQETKSIGEETTFLEDTLDKGLILSYLKEFSLAIGKRLSIATPFHLPYGCTKWEKRCWIQGSPLINRFALSGCRYLG